LKLDDMEKGLVALDDGIWVGDLPVAFFEGVRLKVRRLWNADYAKLYGEMTASLARDDDGKLIEDPEAERRITDECLKRTVLVDWDGIDDPCTADNIEKVFVKPKLRQVWRNAIILASTRAADTYTASIETDAKN
jgi:hypothetical protein